MNPEALVPAYSNTPEKPALKVGSVADLGVKVSTFVTNAEQQTDPSVKTVDSDSESPKCQPVAPSPQALIMTIRRSKALTNVQEDFHLCNDDILTQEPGMMALAAIDSTVEGLHPSRVSINKYLPEPQSLKSVLRLDEAIRRAWLHAIHLEINNLIDNKTFLLNKRPETDELVIPVKT